MRHSLKKILLLVLLIVTGRSNAQNPTFFSVSDTVFVAENAEVHVFGNIVFSGNSAQLFHEGFIQTYEDVNPGNFEIQNDANIYSIGNYKIDNDWINNGHLMIDTGEVEMYGDNQFFDGDSISRFYDLLLTGTSAKEQLQDIRVKHELDLTQRELSVHDQMLYIDNGDPLAIVFDPSYGLEGIISTDEDGIIKKLVFQNQMNVIPTGSNATIFRHRPLRTTLKSAALDTMYVTFHEHSPDLVNAFAIDMDTSLCYIQDEYFYTVTSNQPTNRFELLFSTNQAIDGVYPDLAKWNNPTWKLVYNQISDNADPNYYYVGHADQGDFIQDHYTLAHRTPKRPVIDADTTECYFTSDADCIDPLGQPLYQWTLDGFNPQIVNGQGTDHIDINWNDTIGGFIYLQYQDTEGCWSFPDTVYIEDVHVEASFIDVSQPGTNEYGGNFVFHNTSSYNANQFDWYFAGDHETTYNHDLVQHSFSSPDGTGGDYNIYMVAQDTENGCLDTAFALIHINQMFVFFAPNSFTPDGDGFNDTFFALTSDILKIEMKVYNRWGEIIFDNEAENNSELLVWDGRYSGELVQSGTYTYIFKVWSDNQYVPNLQVFEGSVNVLR
ncbi:MAG: gliding motility-associated C-terminal domain-containing protein [Bacteroidota bacterium]